MTPAIPETEYAYWNVPETPFTITYSLGVFHEIDFQVNEGYRRIPHGGVETGGLLFGRREASSARIEAFRTIECEHASGPSFVLSDRDIEALHQQLDAAGTDPELAGLEVVGWFIAHTRTPLRMHDREVALFDRLFPDPGQVTVLVKPERFQPTRFCFLVRAADGTVSREGTQQAIILPLPGRATRSGAGPVASIPAPEERIPANTRVAEPPAVGAAKPEPQPLPAAKPDAQPVAATMPEPQPVAVTAGEPEPIAAPEEKLEPEPRPVAATPAQPEPRVVLEPEPQPIAAPEVKPEREPQPIAAAAREPAAVAPVEAESQPVAAAGPEPQPVAAAAPEPAALAPVEAEPQPVAAAGPEPQPVAAPNAEPLRIAARESKPEQVTSLVPFSPPEALPSIDEIRRRRSGKSQTEALVYPHFAYEVPSKGANLRLAAVLFVAAALGCAVGYWAYLQLPSATIPLNVRRQSSALVVSWPTGQTREAVYAAMRVDDGQQVPLTPEQRTSGQATITPVGDNVKIELIAQHWMRDSRGIIRYVKAAAPLQAQSVSQ